jgi:hypothetical protein
VKRNICIIFVALILAMFIADISSGQNADSLHIRKANPRGALLRSAFVPGWGQYYNGKYIKGTIFAGGEGYLIYGIVKYWRDINRHRSNFEHSTDPVYQASEFALYNNARDKRNLRLWIISAAIFYSMFDAYVDAQLSDFHQTDKAYQVFLAPSPKNDGIQLGFNFKIR